jgi:flagellar biosynthesis protein FlhA
MERFLAIDPEDKLESLTGTRTTDPTYGLPGLWIDPRDRGYAERCGCIILDAVSVVVTHLDEMIRDHAAELMTLEWMDVYLGSVGPCLRKTVAELRESFSLATLQSVYCELLRQRITIEHNSEIFVTLLDGPGGSLDSLIAQCRHDMRGAICRNHAGGRGGAPLKQRVVEAVVLEPDWERELLCSTDWTELMSGRLHVSLRATIAGLESSDLRPVLMVPDQLRVRLDRLAGSLGKPRPSVMAYSDLAPNFELQVVGTAAR